MVRSQARTAMPSLLLALALAVLSCVALLPTDALSTSMRAEVAGSQILVNGKPFFIKGVYYSPSPIGSHPSWTWPYGDFFLPQYADLWARDFPLLQSLGANTVRISGWNNELDHGYFLDQAHKAGFKVIVTFDIGNAWQNPIKEEWQRQETIGRFMWQFRKYLNHPALLAWSFGEQLNLPGNGYLQAFSDAFQCGWNGGDFNSNPGGCYNNPDTSSACAGPIACVYENFFGFLNTAASYAKNVMGDTRAHLIIASVSDVDISWRRTQQFNYAAENIDAFGLQIYRGRDFGTGDEDFLRNYESATPNNAKGETIGAVKPLIVVEYGIDAYNDPCGKGKETPCYNDVLESPIGGYGEDEDSQAEWGASLSAILSKHSSATGDGAVAGGTINAYIDEAWRCSSGVGGCSGPIPYPLAGFDASQCSWKAHVQCPMLNLWRPSLCGYWTPATFDQYANVGWFGLLKPSKREGDIDHLTPRLLYGRLQEQWSGVTHAWGWLWLLLASLIIGGVCTYVVLSEHRKRAAQVRELEARTSAIGSARSTRSPLGVAGSPTRERRPSFRAQPVGPSSRATSGTNSATRSPDPANLNTLHAFPPTVGGGTFTVSSAMMKSDSPILTAANSSSPLLPALHTVAKAPNES